MRPDLDTRSVRLDDLCCSHVVGPANKPRDNISGGPEVVSAKDWKRGGIEVGVSVVEREDDGLAGQTSRSPEVSVKVSGRDWVIAAFLEPIHLRREIGRGDREGESQAVGAHRVDADVVVGEDRYVDPAGAWGEDIGRPRHGGEAPVLPSRQRNAV